MEMTRNMPDPAVCVVCGLGAPVRTRRRRGVAGVRGASVRLAASRAGRSAGASSAPASAVAARAACGGDVEHAVRLDLRADCAFSMTGAVGALDSI